MNRLFHLARRSSLFEARDTYFAPRKVLISIYNRALVETSPWTITLYLGRSSWIGQETFDPSAAWILNGLETGSCSGGDQSTSSVLGKLLSIFEIEPRVQICLLIKFLSKLFGLEVKLNLDRRYSELEWRCNLVVIANQFLYADTASQNCSRLLILQLTLKSCISYLLLEKPLLKKYYIGSYKAKLNSLCSIPILENLKNTVCLIAHNKSSKRSEKILTAYWRA